ncbi:MAG: hypothetical protein M3O46_18025 [Myxococcota bacterium]|nr:hypothetical protein [Myxococcota bacterium]
MADPLTILLFVASGEGSDATTRAMARATREALGSRASVEVRETPAELSDDEAVIAEQLAHADVVVDLTWSDPGHRNATVRVHLARSGRWIGRSVGFMPSDASTERGRTIGFAVVSMLPEAVSPPSAITPAATGRGPSAPQVDDGVPAPISERDRTLPRDEPPESARPSTPRAFALDLFALAAWGIGSDGGDGGGGGAALQWFPLAPLSLRLGGSIRGGNIASVVQSSTLTSTLSAGVGWHPLRPTSSRAFGVSVRADYLVLYQSLQYQAPRTADVFGANGVTKGALMSGMDVVVDAGFVLAPRVEGVLGLGLEDVFGLTYVILHQGPQGAHTTTIPQLRFIAQVGVRVRF